MQSFQLNEAQVACESIDGELVLVRFDNGHYYSIRGSGTPVWTLLTGGATVAEVAGWLVRHHGLAEADAARDVNEFALGLVAEKVLLPAPARPPAEVAPLAGAYVPPRFEKFDDMADQLLLDKIDDELRPAQWADPPAQP